MSAFKVWECQVCGWTYDEAKGCPEEGLAPGTRWEDIPEDWLCPECGVGKEDFDMLAISDSTPEERSAAEPEVAVASQTYSVWECQVCNWVYDESKGWPEDGIAPGTKWQDIPDDWTCPECGVGKEDFDMLEVKQVAQAVAPSDVTLVPQNTEETAAESTPYQAPIVIIGTGLAGYNLVKELRQLDATVPIVMYTSDDGALYSKPMLSTSFAADRSASDLVQATAEQLARKYDVEINIYTRISGVDSVNKTIQLSDGGLQEYSKLVLATGATCITPPLTGNGVSKVHHINDLLDYAKFRTLVKPEARVLVIGAGLIGSEYANDLIQAGYQVSVVDPLNGALAGLLPAEASNAVSQSLASAGVDFHFGTVVDKIEHQGGGVVATLANGTELQADIVLSAIGVRPNIQLAQASNIDCDKGITVDTRLQTSVTDVYAVGDCAQVNGKVMVYIAPLNAQIKALAKTLTGELTEVKYGVMPVVIKTKLHPVNVSVPISQDGQWVIDVNRATGVKARFLDQTGQLLGYAVTGDQSKEAQALSQQCPPIMD